MTRQKYTLKIAEFDLLFDHLSQFEPRVNASKAKKAARNHDPLALGDNKEMPQEDKLKQLMMLLARAITQCYSTPTNNHLCTSSNTRNQAVIQDGRVDIQSKNVGYARNGNKNAGRQNRNQATNARNGLCHNCNEKGHYARKCPKPRVRDAKYFREQMILATKDEARVHLDEEENDFMLNNAYGDNTLEELNATVIMMLNAIVIMMARIQPTGQIIKQNNLDASSISDYNATQVNKYQLEAEKQRKMNIELKKQQALPQRELKKCKEQVKEIENKPEQNLDYREAYEELQIEMNVEKEQLLNENVSANITIFNLYILFMFW
ncbi:integrase, catalytic region, zinc finger, CCHC-type containing protein [Tanacetum coccineum]